MTASFLWRAKQVRIAGYRIFMGAGGRMQARRRLLTGIVLAVVCAAGILVRLAVPGQDFLGAHPLPFADDPPYHLIRVERLSGSGPAADGPGHHRSSGYIGARDDMLAHPFGDRCIWPWGFDWLAAALIPTDGTCGRDCVQKIAGLVPVGVAAATALVVFLLGIALWRASGRSAEPGGPDGVLVAATATALFLFIPANVAYSLAGRFDHHVMEPLFVALPLALASGRAYRRPFALAAGGLACGLGGAFFPAAPAVTIPVFLAVGLFAGGSREAVIWCVSFLGGTIFSLLASQSPLEWVFFSTSLWHVTAAACLSCGITASHLAREMAGRRRPRGGVGTIAGMTAGLAAFALAGGIASSIFPALPRSFIDGIRYASSTDFAALSMEASSFLDAPLRAMSLTGWLLPLSAVGMFAIAIPGPAGRRRNGVAAFLIAGVSLIALATAQRRFLVASTPLIAVSAAFGLNFLLQPLSRRLAKGGTRSSALVATCAAVLALTPSLGEIQEMEYLTPRDRAMYAAAAAIAQTGEGERGTLAPWGYGHLFKYAADAPTVCDNFFGVPGADAALNRCLSLNYETDETAIAGTLERLKVRFVVLAPPHPDQIRVETALIGLNPDDWVDDRDRLTAKFARSFPARAGIWAATAAIGESGPWNLTLRGRFRQVRPSTGQVEAEVVLLEFRTPERH